MLVDEVQEVSRGHSTELLQRLWKDWIN